MSDKPCPNSHNQFLLNSFQYYHPMYSCFQMTLSLQIFSVKMLHAFIIFSKSDSDVKVLQSCTTLGQTQTSFCLLTSFFKVSDSFQFIKVYSRFGNKLTLIQDTTVYLCITDIFYKGLGSFFL